ncbi:hypothetical protein [Novosphingobium sp. KACC 22771]|uniref:hypothetical protein n=1 Tax=Novosphingobium sp. KACC 22771 TaxID=3025670 RepID=UPI002364FD1F|nr:hypothetical protein [Novosphingobium sp. KACC 22771]WDF71275.1 hypothetical protein PQ467_10630 [Novosphingobium sp. KACC 22771]
MTMVFTMDHRTEPPVDLFQAVAQAQYMAGHCAHLDRSAKARRRLQRAREEARMLAVRAGRLGYGDAVATGARHWRVRRDEVDTSCIVGPQETNASAYSGLLSDYEEQNRQTRRWLNAVPRKSGGGH